MKYKVGKNEVRVYKNLPKGWKQDNSATTNPVGTKWITNGKSRLPKNGQPSERKSALLVTDEKRMIERLAENRRTGRKDRFITDKTTEKKIASEISRQRRQERNIARISQRKRRQAKPAAKQCSCKPSSRKR